MAKKTATARLETAPPATVAERRRALRDTAGPSVRKANVALDLTKADAREKLAALYPRPASETMLDANARVEAAALEYITQRDLAKIAITKQQIAGNELCQAIGAAQGLVGDGWKATWCVGKGSVDWKALAAAEAIPEETIERFRKSGSRTLDVREVAEEGGVR